MRHHNNKRKFHREKSQRTALMRSLARSLIMHESITTTVAKAKELRPYVERLITASKKPSVQSRRLLIERIASQSAVRKLHDTLAPRFASRAGGYTRIVRLGRTGKRVGESARIEFVK